MSQFLVFFTLSVALFISAHAEAKVFPPTFKNACKLDKSDRFDLGWAFTMRTTSPYRGQCIDTSVKRPAILISAGEHGIEFANFFYRGRYYIATVPADSLAKVYFQIAEFKKVLGIIQPAHTQLRFILKKGRYVKLVPQFRGGKTVKLKDFVFSSDYMAPAGVPYDALRGLYEIFMNASRFVSTRDRIEWQIVTHKNTVRQFELNIPSKYVEQVLWASVSWADQRGILDGYSTISMNCTTEAFRMLYLGLEMPVPNPTWRPGNLLDPVTGSSLRRLKNMGLIDADSEVQTLNEEFGYPIY